MIIIIMIMTIMYHFEVLSFYKTAVAFLLRIFVTDSTISAIVVKSLQRKNANQ